VSRREATRLLDEARQLLAAAERHGDAAGQARAAQRALQVNQALPARLGRREALLLAEAYELSGLDRRQGRTLGADR